MNKNWHNGRPGRTGLYDPAQEKDSCGVGFIAHIKGAKSHGLMCDALSMLERMSHRSGCGCEENTGDGSGILTALPDALLREHVRQEAGFSLPLAGAYGAGNVFLPYDSVQREKLKGIVGQVISDQGLKLLGWRKLPQDADYANIGSIARSHEPWIEQLFVGNKDGNSASTSGLNEGEDDGQLERQLYILRKWIGHVLRTSEEVRRPESLYICSLSSRIMVYKGQLTPAQLPLYYADLRDHSYVSHLAMVHSRFSTNTFPSWDRAQPCRVMSHNGEINTVQGNKNWMHARQGPMKSALLGDELSKLYPVIEPDCSDSGTFDNVLELLMMSGRSLPEAVMMMIPEAWENHESMPVAKRSFYEYHANLMEPWDGPASVAFTDGKMIGAVLDRNGLRPSRYVVTDDDRVIMASEVGVLDIEPDKVVAKNRLRPGRMFLVDFEKGQIVSDEKVKKDVVEARPYGKWLSRQRIEIGESYGNQQPEDTRQVDVTCVSMADKMPELLARLKAFGYTKEHLDMLMMPMAENGQEATGAMGDDAPLAVLSDNSQLLYAYFRQSFAQVTNPPIDPIREHLVMSLGSFIGPEGNLLETTEHQAHRVHLPTPVLTDQMLDELKSMDIRGWKVRTVDTTFNREKILDNSEKPVARDSSPCLKAHGQDAHVTKKSFSEPLLDNSFSPQASEQGGQVLVEALERICRQAQQAIEDGCKTVILSDRAVDDQHVAVGALLAAGAVHQHLVRKRLRTKAAVVVESGEPREVHHLCTLLGFGADAVNPYLAHKAITMLYDLGQFESTPSARKAIEKYHKAMEKGILKVMSKMGISTVASYKGAQIFEALGLSQEVMQRCFTGTVSKLGGVDFDVLAAEILYRHQLGYPRRQVSDFDKLPNPGDYYWRTGGERHAVTPKSIASLQEAAKDGSRSAYDEYVKEVDADARQRCTLRGLLKIRGEAFVHSKGDIPAPDGSIPLEEVEPVAEIVKRFRTGAMSFGSLSKEAHETLAVAMNRMGGRSNTGEGGEDPERFKVQSDGDSKRSSIKQVASGRFGVTSHYLANGDTLQIKIAQGAKPGEGGQLPGYKVSNDIARVRHSTPGVSLISPPPHHDIYSIEDLAQLIFDLKHANPKAQVSVKLVSEAGVGTVAAGVAKAQADHILISGYDGGTGASPMTSIKHAGLPWELGLAETHQTLVLNGLRSRVRLETDGGMRTGRDVIIAACLGAEEVGFATAPMIAMGCIMMRKCHLNTCPVGICTQDPQLRKKFTGQPEHVMNYLFLVAEEVRQYMAAMGVRTWGQLVGNVALLEAEEKAEHWKSKGLDLSAILEPVSSAVCAGAGDLKEQPSLIDDVLDQRLIEKSQDALNGHGKVQIESNIGNTDRTVGAMLSYYISSRWGEKGLAEDSIELNLHGSAGQSLGAFLAPGVTINLRGDANDYVGKGLSGGKIIVAPPADAKFIAEENIIIGNVALYGATSGKAFFRGIAAERFAVRNSGALAVVEGVGDHGCEYMTGGRVVVLGSAGRNFAAGMSGGIAYVYDRDGDFIQNCNLGMVGVGKIEKAHELDELKSLIEQHQAYTGSTVAKRILSNWQVERNWFAQVMPTDYQRILELEKQRDQQPDIDLPVIEMEDNLSVS